MQLMKHTHAILFKNIMKKETLLSFSLSWVDTIQIIESCREKRKRTSVGLQSEQGRFNTQQQLSTPTTQQQQREWKQRESDKGVVISLWCQRCNIFIITSGERRLNRKILEKWWFGDLYELITESNLRSTMALNSIMFNKYITV